MPSNASELGSGTAAVAPCWLLISMRKPRKSFKLTRVSPLKSPLVIESSRENFRPKFAAMIRKSAVSTTLSPLKSPKGSGSGSTGAPSDRAIISSSVNASSQMANSSIRPMTLLPPLVSAPIDAVSIGVISLISLVPESMMETPSKKIWVSGCSPCLLR